MTRPSRSALWSRGLCLAGLTMTICLGCSVDAVLDDTFLGETGIADIAPLPRNALQIDMVNQVSDESLTALMAIEFERTDGTRFKLNGTDEFGVSDIFQGVELLGGVKISRIYRCSDTDAIEAITVGSLDDPTVPGAAIVFPNRAVTVLVPYGTILRRGVHFNCGQIIQFAVSDDPVEQTEWRVGATVICGQQDCGQAPAGG